MKALKHEHIGPQETNRVQYISVDRKWVIRPPRNYKLDSSLPPNMAIIDRREKARLEEQARVLSQIIKNAHGNKIAEQLIEKSLNEVRFLALGGTGAVGSEDTPIDTYMRVEEADCVNSTFEEAITPPNPKLIVNSKISKPTIARVMIANSAAENTGMCATQYPKTFIRAAIAARETMAEGMGIHALDLSSEAGALRGVSALSDKEKERLEAALAAERRLSKVEVAHLQEANQLHLDARTAAAAPSAPMVRSYTVKDAEIRETMMRQANKEGGFVDWAYTTTDKGGDTKQKQQQHARAWYWDCLLYTSPSPRDRQKSRMPSSA